MENRSHALWAGIFTLTMICATILAGMWLKRDTTIRDDYQIVTMSAISGLNPQAAVRYKGLAVGRVDSIEFDTSKAGQLIINISIDPDTPMTQSTYATLGYQGVTGIAFIQLDDDGTNPHKLETAANNNAVPRIPLRAGLFEQLQKSSTAILANAEKVSGQLATFFDVQNQKIILNTFANASAASERFKNVADNLTPTVEQLPKLALQANKTMASIEQLAQSANQLSGQLTQLTQQLNSPNGALNQSLNSVNSLSMQLQTETIPKINQLSTDASQTMQTFNQTLQELKERPQSLVFGKAQALPGPGEAGYVEPNKPRQ